ncbi:unnamed protein product [Rotaria socialis]|uniref:Uncharacterized protein n=1 Tax=Rotaria socialis TaxID=392032 RepID=A0A818AWS7_9BILA|nr:unnamed protein product [Rotaria socialis]CAF4873283.1 unnamed protein product [Rotaria socialis]
MNLSTLGFLMVLAVSIGAEEEQTNGQTLNLQGSQTTGSDIAKDGRFKKIVGFYLKTTYLSIRTRTTSAIWTCILTSTAAAPRTQQQQQIRKRRSAHDIKVNE